MDQGEQKGGVQIYRDRSHHDYLHHAHQEVHTKIVSHKIIINVSNINIQQFNVIPPIAYQMCQKSLEVS